MIQEGQFRGAAEPVIWVVAAIVGSPAIIRVLETKGPHVIAATIALYADAIVLEWRRRVPSEKESVS